VARRLPLAYQILALQLAILIAAAVVGAAAVVWQARQELDRQYEQRSLAIAESVASMSTVQEALLGTAPRDSVQVTAEAVRKSTGATYVVVADRAGIRYSHPNPALIGLPVDEDPTPVLAGHTWVGVQAGTLCTSARGKAPVIHDGAVIGMTSVGFCEATVTSQLLRSLPGYAAIIVLVLALGVLGALLLARRLKQQTFGLEPYEIAGLLEEREASLRGIGEGALATAADGTITLANEEAQRLLGLGPECVGRKIGQALPAGRLQDFLAGKLRDEDELVLAGERVIAASRRAVQVRGRQIGHVITLRDSSELSRLSNPLGVESLTDALRAQAHEFSNRLHAISGLVELGRTEEAVKLITATSGLHQELSEALLERVGDPVLGALLLAKAAIASERGVELRVSDDTMLTDHELEGDDLITLLGNLVENGIEAAATGGGEERYVEVAVGVEGDDLVMRVHDSGSGVPADLIDRIFVEGFTTKRRPGGARRGIGLALALEIARRNGGDLTVRNEAGAVFEARFPARKAVRT
jgi:two-component system, CitB family, sensor kinase